MRRDIRESDYAALAEVRYRIRQFLRGGDEDAKAVSLEPQQYQLLLALRALPHQSDATIRLLAERLYLRHHSVVGLVDRLEARGYVRRDRDVRDQRQVLVMLLPAGQQALEKIVQKRLHELRATGQALVQSIAVILEENRRPQNKQHPGSASTKQRHALTKSMPRFEPTLRQKVKRR
jgi:DNA-binding MarR family transcriptional regulator